MNNPMIAVFAVAVASVTLATEKAPTPASPAYPVSSMQSFVILFRQGPHPLTEADRARRQAAISTWAREQNAAGHKLEPRTLASETASPGVATTPDTTGAWPVSALLFLEARDFAEATLIAASHPAKDYNVSAEVRPWSPPPVPAPSPKAKTKANGPFDVTTKPQSAADAAVGRFALEKQYHGDLDAVASGEMLTAMTAVKGSAGYVAIEKVTGSLAGRSGTFHLQHLGVMNRGTPAMTITVVPDSGTGDLTGLTGTLNIKIAPDGAHPYEFEYSLPEQP